MAREQGARWLRRSSRWQPKGIHACTWCCCLIGGAACGRVSVRNPKSCFPLAWCSSASPAHIPRVLNPRIRVLQFGSTFAVAGMETGNEGGRRGLRDYQAGRGKESAAAQRDAGAVPGSGGRAGVAGGAPAVETREQGAPEACAKTPLYQPAQECARTLCHSWALIRPSMHSISAPAQNHALNLPKGAADSHNRALNPFPTSLQVSRATSQGIDVSMDSVFPRQRRETGESTPCVLQHISFLRTMDPEPIHVPNNRFALKRMRWQAFCC